MLSSLLSYIYQPFILFIVILTITLSIFLPLISKVRVFLLPTCVSNLSSFQSQTDGRHNFAKEGKRRKKERIPVEWTKIIQLLNKKIANCLAWHVRMFICLAMYHAMTFIIQVGRTTEYILGTAFKRFLSSCFWWFGWIDHCEKIQKQIFHVKQRKKTKFNICGCNY